MLANKLQRNQTLGELIEQIKNTMSILTFLTVKVIEFTVNLFMRKKKAVFSQLTSTRAVTYLQISVFQKSEAELFC